MIFRYLNIHLPKFKSRIKLKTKSMIQLIKTDSSNKDFQNLVSQLDVGLKTVDGDMHDFYHQYNGISNIKYAIVAYQNEKPVGCGAIKKSDDKTMEVKRMYVLPSYRNQGVATIVLSALEDWAKDLRYKRCVLETGKLQVEALRLYEKNGYQIISLCII